MNFAKVYEIGIIVRALGENAFKSSSWQCAPEVLTKLCPMIKDDARILILILGVIILEADYLIFIVISLIRSFTFGS
jgi:hypothetical protein